MVIQNYMAANNLSGYTKLTSGSATGMYYKITVAPTGTNSIDINSEVILHYTGQLMNNTFFDNFYAPTPVAPATTASTATFLDISTLTAGFKAGLLILGKGGGSMSMLIPSRLAYGNAGASGIPAA